MRKRKICRIPNEGARKTTFFKRKQGLMKKLHELSTLCGVQACGVIFSPFQSEPEFWPSKSGAKEVVSRFLKMPTKKMLNQATYLDEMIIKTQKQTENMAAECRDLELKKMLSECFEGKMPEFGDGKNHLDLVSHIDKLYEKVIRRHLELSGESSSSSCFPGGFAGTSSIPTGGFMDLASGSGSFAGDSFAPTGGFMDLASGSGSFAGDSFTPTVGFLTLASDSGGFGGASTGGGAGGFGELGQGSGGFGSLDSSSSGSFYGAAGLGGGGFGDQSISDGFGGLGGQSSDGGGCLAFGGNTGTTGNPSDLFTQIGALDAAPSGLYDQNEQELVQYVAPNNLYDHNQHGSDTFMDGSNYYNILQLPFADLAITSHMPSSSTGVYAPDVDNNL